MRTIFFIFAFTFIVCQYTSDAQGGLDKLRANIPGEPGKSLTCGWWVFLTLAIWNKVGKPLFETLHQYEEKISINFFHC